MYTQDNWYRGYLIPEGECDDGKSLDADTRCLLLPGTLVLENAWFVKSCSQSRLENKTITRQGNEP